MSVYEEVKKALQDVVAPELKALQTEIRRLDEKIDSLRVEMHSEMRRIDGRIDSLEKELRTAIEIRERLTAPKARLPALQKS